MPQQSLIWASSNTEVGVEMLGMAEDQNSTEGNVTRLGLTGNVFVRRGFFFFLCIERFCVHCSSERLVFRHGNYSSAKVHGNATCKG